MEKRPQITSFNLQEKETKSQCTPCSVQKKGKKHKLQEKREKYECFNFSFSNHIVSYKVWMGAMRKLF